MVCDCGTTWTFLLPFLQFNAKFISLFSEKEMIETFHAMDSFTRTVK